MKPIVRYFGRICSVWPVEAGRALQAHCEVSVMKREAPCPDNGWQEQQVPQEHVLHWEDVDPEDKRPVWCTLSGYGYFIQAQLRKQYGDIEVHDHRPPKLSDPVLDHLKAAQWRGSQLQAIIKVLANRGGIIDCPTGWGKTYVMSMIARCYPNDRIVVTVPSVDVARDIWHRFCGVVPDLGFVGDAEHDVQRVTVAVTHSLKWCHPQTGLVLVDEVHAVLTPTFLESFQRFKDAKMFGFTASTERPDGADRFAEAAFGPVIHEVPYAEAQESGNVVPIRVQMIKVQQGPRTVSIKNKVKKDREGIWRNNHRNQIVAQAARAAEQDLGPGGQILIMVDKTEHAMVLQHLLPDYEVVHGATSKERAMQLAANGALVEGQQVCTPTRRRQMKEAFARGELKKVIATFVWSKGVDFADLKVLIRADGLATSIASIQVPGRLSRLGSDGNKGSATLIDFMDSFSPDLERRSKERARVYRKNGWSIDQTTPAALQTGVPAP